MRTCRRRGAACDGFDRQGFIYPAIIAVASRGVLALLATAWRITATKTPATRAQSIDAAGLFIVAVGPTLSGFDVTVAGSGR